MAAPAVATQYAIGACLNCRNLFLVTPANPECLLCGRPATLTLPFPGPESPFAVETPSAAEPEAPPAPLTPMPITCPVCNAALELVLNESEIYLQEAPSEGPVPFPAMGPPAEEPAPEAAPAEPEGSLSPGTELEETPAEETPGA